MLNFYTMMKYMTHALYIQVPRFKFQRTFNRKTLLETYESLYKN